MAVRQMQLRCAKCDALTTHTVQQTNHILHLLLSVFTLGIWLIVWLLVGISSGAAKCEQCGSWRKGGAK